MNFTSVFEELNSLYEDKVEDTPIEDIADEVVDEVVDDEAVAIEDAPATEEEPKQVILECSKCGALAMVEESDVEIDEESNLVNIDVACQYCEETAGYKILGSLSPYSVPGDAEEADKDLDELFNVKVDARGFGGSGNDVSVLGSNIPALEELEEQPESDDELDEGIFDFGKKKREAEIARQEEEERKRREEERLARNTQPYESEYDRRKREREEREADRRMASYRQAGQGWRDSLNDRGTKPSNTPYAGVNYSGGDYF